MSAVLIFPQGEDSRGEMFWASEGAPPADDFIKSIAPAGTRYSVEQIVPQCIKIDTETQGCVVTAVPWVVLKSGERRGFFRWYSTRGEISVYSDKLNIKKDDGDCVGLFYSSDVPWWWWIQPRKLGPTWWILQVLKLFKRLPPPKPLKRLSPIEEKVLADMFAKRISSLKLPPLMEEKIPQEEEVLTRH